MKILSMSDLHIGKYLHKQNLILDQKYILEKIFEIIKKEDPDIITLSGDIYDKYTPSSEAFDLFNQFITNLSSLNKKIFIIAGNHDDITKISYLSDILIRSNIYVSKPFNGAMKKIPLCDEYGVINIYLLPFIKPVDVKPFYENIKTYDDAVKMVIENTNINKSERNVILAHQYVKGSTTSESEEHAIGGLDQISSEIFKDFDLVLLGHLHKAQKVKKDNIRYTGSVLKYDFSEENHKKSIALCEIKEKNNLDIKLIDLKPLKDLRVINASLKDIEKMKYSEDYIKIVLTDTDIQINDEAIIRNVFPNTLIMARKNLLGENILEEIDISKFKSKDPISLLKDFYKTRMNKDLDGEKLEIVKDIFKELKENNETN